MTDISTLLFKIIDERGAMAVAIMLGHNTTTIVARWKREGSIPEAKKWHVQETLKKEGIIK